MKISLPTIAFAAALLAPCLPAAAAPDTAATSAQAPHLIPILANAKSFSVTETMSQIDAQGHLVPYGIKQVQYGQGGKYYVDVRIEDKGHREHVLAVSDGTHRYQYMPLHAKYRTMTATADPIASGRLQLETMPSGTPTKTALAGKPALLFQQSLPLEPKHRFTVKTWMDAKTHLLQQMSIYDLFSGKPVLYVQSSFFNWKINPATPADRFVFVPPAGAKEVVADTPLAPPVLLANGTLAPDFAVQDQSGKPVRLSDYKGKVVVLDFWSTWCEPCQASLPHTQTVAAQFAPQGVVVLAVNVWDTKPAFDKWLPAHADFRSIAFAFDPSPDAKQVTDAYHVSGIPTQYIVGKDGKITQSFVGYDGPTADLANAITSALKGSH